MLSSNEQYGERANGLSREAIPPAQYGSLGSRRQSVRPVAPPPVNVADFGRITPQVAHPYAQRNTHEVDDQGPYSLAPSESSSRNQPALYQPRQALGLNGEQLYTRVSVSGRRPMDPLEHEAQPQSSNVATTSSVGSQPPPDGNRDGNRLAPSNAPLSPPRHTSTRPSSRRALVQALSLAQNAVQLDTAGNDPRAAVEAYGQSVRLLREVMGRVSSGESAGGSLAAPPESSSSSSRALTPREQEVRRLRSIHDTYAERLVVLCNMYHLPMPDVQGPSAVRPPAPSAPPSRSTSQEMLSASYQSQSRGASRSPRPLEQDGSGLALASPLATAPEREARPTNPFSPDSIPLPASSSSNASLNRMSTLPPQRPPPSGPPPPKPLTPLTARPDLPLPPPSGPADHHSSLLQQPIETSVYAHRRVPSFSSEGTGADDSDRTEVLPSRPTSVVSAIRRSEASDGGQTIHAITTDIASDASTAQIMPARSPTSPTPMPSPSTPRGGGSEAQSKRGVSTGSQISTTTYDSATSSSGLRSRGNTSSSASSWSDTGADSDKPGAIRSVGQGSIALRRKANSGASSTGVPPPMPPPLPPQQQLPPLPGPSQSAGLLSANPSNRLTADSLPPSTLSSLGIGPGRSRAVSQPGRRPSNATNIDANYNYAGERDGRPPLPGSTSANIPRKPSVPHSIGSGTSGSHISRTTVSSPGINITVQTAGGLSVVQAQTPGLQNTFSSSYFMGQASSASGIPTHGPPSPPVDPLRRPFHLMALLLASLTSRHGSFLTRRLYIPHDVWSQGGAKLSNLSEKGKCVEILNSGLEEVALGSGEFFRGAGRGNAERWLKCLDEWGVVCDSVLTGPGKKLGVGEGFLGKKNGAVSGLGSRFTKALDRITTAKGFDSPVVYTNGLSKLLQQAQMFDEHVKAFSNSFTPTPYSTLDPDVRHQIELRLKRSAEFFASVVLTWVVRDLRLLLDKYVKKGEKWLAE